uniref:40S ribosomal protein S15 n=1 Tax=Hyaloperonospora arabidopsidis (strain Emoy2) TaxID=559515 RepID=M4BFI4_HYAAE
MADQSVEDKNLELAALRKKRTFRKFSYRGVDLDKLLDLNHEELMDLVNARARRRFSRGLKRKPMALIKRLRKAKAAARPMERPEGIKTHLRNMIIVPEMIGSVVGVYNGKEFNGIEIKVCVQNCSRALGGCAGLQPEEWCTMLLVWYTRLPSSCRRSEYGATQRDFTCACLCYTIYFSMGFR